MADETEQNRRLFLIDTKLATVEELAQQVLDGIKQIRQDAQADMNGAAKTTTPQQEE